MFHWLNPCSEEVVPTAIKSVVPLLVATLLVACNPPQESSSEPPLRLVRTLTIGASDNDIWRELPGVVEANREANLSFRLSGELQQLLAKEGDEVEQNQLLAALDATDYQIQLNSRQAEYAKAEADFNRAQQLVKRGAISRSDFEQLKANQDIAQASLAAANQNIQYTQLRAPFAGRIARRYVDNYEDVSAQQTIYNLQDPTAVTIRVNVPETIMIRVREGDRPEVLARFDQIPERQFPLELKEVSTQADAQTKTFAVKFTMPRVTEFNILPGMSVTVQAKPKFLQHGAAPQYYVPPQAVLEDSNGQYVYLVQAEDSNLGSVHRRTVAVGELSELGLTITDGLHPGDQVIIAGMSKMSPGLRVRLGD